MDDDYKGWLPEGTTQGDLDDGDFAWLSDAYKAGKQSKTDGRKLPFKIAGKVNTDGWKAAWSRAHSMSAADFEGGPSQSAVLAALLKDKPAGVDVAKSATPLQHKMCESPNLKFFGDDTNPSGGVSGYLSTFGNLDRGGEIVMKGAFTNTIDSFVKNGFFALNHNWDVLPIGTITKAHEDDLGLYFSADFHSYPAAQEARTVAMERLARGKSVSTSIGYKPTDKERTKDALLLKGIDLYEGSMVNVPMNPLPTIGAVKGLSFAEMFDAAFDLPDGSTFADQLEAVRAAVEASLCRAKAIQEMRAKEGRVLSTANVSRMRDMAGSLQDHANTLAAMCDQAAPKSAAPISDAARQAHIQYLLTQARQLGVPV